MTDEHFLTDAQERMRVTILQLANAYGTSPATIVKKIGNTPPVGKRGKANVWLLGDVTEMLDVRDINKNADPDEPYIETDPDKMKPGDRKTYYQAEDLRQSSLIKQRKNAIEARELIPAGEVERTIAIAFKETALMLDTLSDTLERDGYIQGGDVEAVTGIVDSCREELAMKLGVLSKSTVEMNDEGGWVE